MYVYCIFNIARLILNLAFRVVAAPDPSGAKLESVRISKLTRQRRFPLYIAEINEHLRFKEEGFRHGCILFFVLTTRYVRQSSNHHTINGFLSYVLSS